MNISFQITEKRRDIVFAVGDYPLEGFTIPVISTPMITCIIIDMMITMN